MSEKKSKNSGLTLIETLVAVMIFATVATTAISILISNIRAQRFQFGVQNLQDNARYIMEAMIKDIRMSSLDAAQPKTAGDSSNFVAIVKESANVIYTFDGSDVQKDTGGGNQQVNSSDVDVDGGFYVVNPVDGKTHPRVTIHLKVRPAGAAAPEINLQNTVSLRSYE